jgi:hypothetical protein
MVNNSSRLDDFIRSIERMVIQLENLAASFLSAVLEFLEVAYEKILDVTKRIADYLARLIRAVSRLSVALFKLALFYVPSLFCILGGIAWESDLLLLLGALWTILVTAIGLYYRR